MKLIKPTQINEYQDTKADKIIETVFIIGLSLILLILSVFILATTSYAESAYFPMHQNDNGHFNDDTMALIDSYFNAEDNNIFVKYIDYNYYCVSYSKSSSGGVYGEIYSNGTNFSLYTSGSVSISVKQFQIMYGNIVNVSNWGSNLYYFNNSPSSLVNSGVDYISNYRVYTNSNNTDTVLMYGQVPFEPAQGHATPTGFDNADNVNTDGHAQQPSNPTFPTFTPPTIDTSTLETLVESLIDFVKEFADFVGQCFSVFFSWLVGVLQNGFQSVINTIRDFADNFYNNMVSLFEPIAQNIEYFVSPIDTNVIETTIEDTNFYGVYSDFTSFNSTFDGAFNIQEPDNFTITIHVEDIDILNQQNPYILNLGSNFYPFRSALRTFLWILVTFASVFFVEHNLSSWLKGSGEEK